MASSFAEQGPILSVIIPCYNEEKNLQGGVLDEVYEYLERQTYPWEVIIVDDGSTDDSRDLVRRSIENKENFGLLEAPHGGKPAAIWAGIQQARGEVVLLTDMDQSTPIGELEELWPWHERGFDVVIGSRGISREGYSLLRRVGSVVFRTLRRLFLLRDISDTQCGFKMCRRQAALNVFPRLEYFRHKGEATGWKVTAYDVELLYLCEKAGYTIKEVVVRWSNRDRSDTKGQSGELARYLYESIDMLRQVIRVKLNQVRGLYKDVA